MGNANNTQLENAFMSQDISTRSQELLAELGLIQPDENITATPLTGGVASDIAHIRTSHHEYCVKFALQKLKVEADWFAPTHRNLAEYAWLKYAASQHTEMAITLFGQSAQHHGFVMEYLNGADVYLWKNALLEGTSTGKEAAIIGRAVGIIHASSSQSNFDRTPFYNKDDFKDLRIEPYLLYTAAQHPDLQGTLHHLADRLYHSELVLIHGDVSPKNIFLRQSSPIILDAECATMGDPVFDIAFCLNHLVLKASHLPDYRQAYLGYVHQFWENYSPHICWENPKALEARLCALLPALMLARIDGKSPVEYLEENTRNQIRSVSRHLLHNPNPSLAETLTHLHSLKS